MRTPKKNTGKKASQVAKKKSGLADKQPIQDPAFFSDENDDEFDLPINELDLDELDPLDEDDEDF